MFINTDIYVHGLEELILSKGPFYPKWFTDSVQPSAKIPMTLFKTLKKQFQNLCRKEPKWKRVNVHLLYTASICWSYISPSWLHVKISTEPNFLYFFSGLNINDYTYSYFLAIVLSSILRFSYIFQQIDQCPCQFGHTTKKNHFTDFFFLLNTRVWTHNIYTELYQHSFFFLFWIECHCITKLPSLGSNCSPLGSASQRAGVTGVFHHTQLHISNFMGFFCTLDCWQLNIFI